MYVLVEFTDEKCLAIIPSNCRKGNQCAVWPVVRVAERLNRMVKSKYPAESSWKAFPIRELYQHGNFQNCRLYKFGEKKCNRIIEWEFKKEALTNTQVVLVSAYFQH